MNSNMLGAWCFVVCAFVLSASSLVVIFFDKGWLVRWKDQN